MPRDLLKELIQEAKTKSADEFGFLHSGYFFLVSLPGGDDDFDYMDFHTEIHSSKHHQIAKKLNLPGGVGFTGGAEEALSGQSAYEVKKQPHNEWMDWISIGRATNNDVAIPHQSVSKLHAKIHTGKDGRGFARNSEEMWITDMNSSGTWVNGNMVESTEPQPLAVGDTVRLGQVDCEFLRGERLYRAVLRMS